MIISSRIKRPYTFICGMIILLVTGFILLIYDRYLSVVPGIIISHESGFYNDAIEITVQDTKVDKVFFQINGEEPINQYNSPICLEGSYDGNSYSVVFWYQDQEGVLSEPIERNYLVLNGDRSISTDYVVMLWGNEEELFGYEDGILVAGKSFDEFMERTPDFSLYGTRPVGNYSSNAERLVHTVFMDKAGNELITQNCGVRVSGNWTRAKAQKSLKLTARKTYDEKNEFSYPFFEDYFPEDGSRLIEDYHSLVLHSSGNDNGNGFIRNALCNQLADMSGFKDTTQAKSVTVWINDQYQGVYWLQNNYDKRYFSEKYGEYKGQFTVTEGTLSGMDTEKIVEDPNEIRAIEEFNSLCNDLYLMDMDAANQEDWEYISSVIDVDNFIKYVAIEIYINNTDWGTNNVKVYRYFPEDGEELTDGTVFDGRYRYLLYDMDYGLGLFAFGVYGLDASYDRLEELLNENNECSKLFRVIMKREECREKLASEIVGLINGAFSVENAVPVLKQLIQSQQDELHHMVENTAILARSLYPTDVTNSDNIDKEYEKIETFLADRPEYMYESLGKAFGYNDRYLINLTGVEGLAIDMNDRPMDKTADVLDIPIRLSSNTAGIQIHGWYINNQYFPGNVVEFMPSQYCDETKNIIAKPDWEIVSGSLRIQNAQISGTEDYVVLKNEGLSDVYLQDYAISDTFLNLFKFTLPDVLLKPGEQFTIYGSKYSGEQDKDSLQVSFSWNKLEAVYLSHVIEGLIDTW